MDTRHRIDCEYWHDQYPWECSCGATPRMTYREYADLRRKAWAAADSSIITVADKTDG